MKRHPLPDKIWPCAVSNVNLQPCRKGWWWKTSWPPSSGDSVSFSWGDALGREWHPLQAGSGAGVRSVWSIPSPSLGWTHFPPSHLSCQSEFFLYWGEKWWAGQTPTQHTHHGIISVNNTLKLTMVSGECPLVYIHTHRIKSSKNPHRILQSFLLVKKFMIFN